MTLKGEYIGLRALEPDDISFLYSVENNPSIWEVSETVQPFSRSLLQNYLKQAGESITESHQLRLLIYALKDARSLGFLDFYDYDGVHSRVGIGIVILQEEDRSRGFGSEAIRMATSYAFEILKVHQVFAYIIEDNLPSIRLFESSGYNKTGVRKDWIRGTNGFVNQLIYQNIFDEKP